MNKGQTLAQTIRYCGILICLALALTACQEEVIPTPTRPPPTAVIRHRDAAPFMLTLDDLGQGYQIVEQHRLEKGKGWNEEATRLSGYRHVYQGTETPFTTVICQVECYLSVNETFSAYRAYKEELVSRLQEQYASINESETHKVGDWAAVLSARNPDNENERAFYYLFTRENILVEVTLIGPNMANFDGLSLQQAQVVDQRITARE